MSANEELNPNIAVRFAGPVNGSLVIGNNNVQDNRSATSQVVITNAVLALLQQELAGLKQRIEQEAPNEVRAEAVERLEALETAMLADKPDLSAMERVKSWFVENLPVFAGSVTSLIVNPIVGKLVEAAGEALASEVRRSF